MKKEEAKLLLKSFSSLFPSNEVVVDLSWSCCRFILEFVDLSWIYLEMLKISPKVVDDFPLMKLLGISLELLRIYLGVVKDFT